MLGAIRHNLAGLARFSGRDTRETFWPYALLMFLVMTFATVLLFIPTFFETMTRMQRFAIEHPDQATVTQGPGSYSIEIQGNHPELMPDFGSLLTGTTIISLVFFLLIAAAVVRRLHDRGSSGAWGLLPLLFLPTGMWLMPVVMRSIQSGTPDFSLFGLLFLNNLIYLASIGWLIFLLASEGTEGPNRYGEDPTPPEARRRRRSPPRRRG